MNGTLSNNMNEKQLKDYFVDLPLIIGRTLLNVFISFCIFQVYIAFIIFLDFSDRYTKIYNKILKMNNVP